MTANVAELPPITSPNVCVTMANPPIPPCGRCQLSLAEQTQSQFHCPMEVREKEQRPGRLLAPLQIAKVLL